VRSRCRKAEDPVAQLKIEAEMAARVAAKAKELVEAAMQSEEVQKTIESRLREERANLENKVRPWLTPPAKMLYLLLIQERRAGSPPQHHTS
jgi:hypothetical protein